jgi:phytanoyl-CoA hydroxylase
MNFKKNYESNGYVLIKNLFSKSLCKRIKNKSTKLKPKLKIPFSNIAWGFGDVRTKKPFDQLIKNEKMDKILSKLVNKNIKLSHFMLVNKAAWIGPDVEWHQEVFNKKIYAPGINMKKNWNRFIQVFIAVDDHEIKNGCLKVFERSHKAGELKHDDFINTNGSHKRRVKTSELDKLNKKFKIKEIEMKPGDALFFNHLLVHGSSSNMSSISRLSALLQFYDNSLSFKSNRFDEYSDFRIRFIKKWLKEFTKKLPNYKKNLKDFNKGKS